MRETIIKAITQYNSLCGELSIPYQMKIQEYQDKHTWRVDLYNNDPELIFREEYTSQCPLDVELLGIYWDYAGKSLLTMLLKEIEDLQNQFK